MCLYEGPKFKLTGFLCYWRLVLSGQVGAALIETSTQVLSRALVYIVLSSL